MADIAPKERLLPSLLDRLTDERPRQREESRDQRVGTELQLRQSVMRDLESLLNTVNLESEFAFDAWPELRGTVINYGMPGLSGNTLRSADLELIRERIQQCIEAFEPRILKSSLRVTLIEQTAEERQGAIAYQIEGMLWGQPMPEALFLRTDLDLELGDVTVSDA